MIYAEIGMKVYSVHPEHVLFEVEHGRGELEELTVLRQRWEAWGEPENVTVKVEGA